MIFSELYSAYYNAVAEILAKAIDGERDEKVLRKIVEEKAFGESAVTVLPALKSGKWQLMKSDLTPVIKHKPTMPLTLLQKMWLRAVSLDPRVTLFGIDFSALEDVPPLFTPDDYFIYDRYSDGDPYEDEGYRERFRTVLDAVKNRTKVYIEMINRKGDTVHMVGSPYRLEYSEKDDKFRVLLDGCGFGGTVNLGRMTVCRPYTGSASASNHREPIMKTATLTVTDERNALERVMLHFAHFEKQAEKIDEKHYRLDIKYDRDDDTELIIRILSFGPLVKAEAPTDLVRRIKERLILQKNCNLK